MALFRSFNEIVNSMRERLKLTQPNLDTKVGTVSRDLFIDVPAEQIEKLNKAIIAVSEKQSPATASGSDVDKWASNLDIPRKGGSASSGVVVVTLNELNSDILIPAGTNFTAKNGVVFKSISNNNIIANEKSRYAAIASRLRKSLNLSGISDKYALEITVQASSNGRNGNIGPNQIISSSIREGLRVTNLTSFSGGDNSENDASYKARIFSKFSGSNTGTEAGYRSAALSVSGVSDALVVKPGSTLMQRDGTEVIQVNDGSFRITESGTGGKVDVYILGQSLSDQAESYIYIDKSGSGNAADERNFHILGISSQDTTRTLNERRILSLKDKTLPLQPVSSIISVSGSSSGLFTEKFTTADGTFGNYELVKDSNKDTGGSPFGYDYIKFISNEKVVNGEVIIRQSSGPVDSLRFSEINELSSVYQDKIIKNENSKVSISDRSLITLNHNPITTVSRVINSTTGEVYVIADQNQNSSGINTSGRIKISGKTLPSVSDTLSVDYVWRHTFDEYIDYNGKSIASSFDSQINDTIDWGISKGIFSELAVLNRDDDLSQFTITTDFNISSVLSVKSYTEKSATINSSRTIVLSQSDDVIINILSVLDSNGIDIWNTNTSDGTFSGRTIYLPTDIEIVADTACTVKYNTIEYFNIENSDASFSNATINLPSDDILVGAGLFDTLNQIYLTDSNIYVTYVSELINILPQISLSSLPVTGQISSNNLTLANLSVISGSNQPIYYSTEDDVRQEILRFGPTQLACQITGIVRPGKMRISGTSLERVIVEIKRPTNITNLTVSIQSEVLSLFGLSANTNSIGIARIDNMSNENYTYDVSNVFLKNNEFDLLHSNIDTTLSNLSFTLNNTAANTGNNPSSSEIIYVTCLIYRAADFEDLYFSKDQEVITSKRFAFIDSISAISGFRNQSNVLVGSVKIVPANTPSAGTTYLVDYNFKAPKEGERITVRYTNNKLISDVTLAIEDVRSITADVLVKEASILEIDVIGEIVINENSQESETQIIENVINAVNNLLNSNSLGSTIDYSDVINVATGVSGVDSANISLFNESQSIGRRNFIKALDNQTLSAGTVSFSSVSRKDFRIT